MMNMQTSTAEFAQPAPPLPLSESLARKVTNPRRSLRLGNRLRYGWTLGPLLLVTLWAAGSAAGLIDPRGLPAPWTIVETAGALIADGRLQDNLIISATRVAEGFSIGVTAGIVFALIAGLSRIGEYLLDGVIQLHRAIPVLAIIPLVMLYMGIGEGMKITTIAMATYIPVYLNVHSSLRATDARFVELADSLHLSYSDFIRHVILPGAMPGLFLGVRFAVTVAWIALVFVEQINATSGIGYMINLAGTYGQVDIVIVGIVLYAILGFTSDHVVRFLERRALSWRRTLSN
jgi:sulfonate transport system permease protein